MLFKLMTSVEVLCSSADVVGCKMPADAKQDQSGIESDNQRGNSMRIRFIRPSLNSCKVTT